ncbi:hypothetical protein GCM10009733_010330 [Nonomuraea maheshkhaliensis]|uniref:Uncharacterized protein n=1 Tax=Nonomuraea maheshkhaliensis TaxID=419590 RepID=A0ABN2ES27_9ACTN
MDVDVDALDRLLGQHGLVVTLRVAQEELHHLGPHLGGVGGGVVLTDMSSDAHHADELIPRPSSRALVPEPLPPALNPGPEPEPRAGALSRAR